MSNPLSAIDDSITSIKNLAKLIEKGSTVQVRSRDELSLIKATSFAWFQNDRPIIAASLGDNTLKIVDDYFKDCLELSEKGSARSTYKSVFRSLVQNLVILRGDVLSNVGAQTKSSLEDPPDFSPLVLDAKMREILERRWSETRKCINADAPLSSVVMMGGILEAILLTKINSFPEKEKIFKLKSAPIDKKTAKVMQLHEWSLKNYIEVAHEIGWITPSVKDVGEVLRDYRNYIHPYKEYSHGIVIIKSDAELFWNITKNIIRQLLLNK